MRLEPDLQPESRRGATTTRSADEGRTAGRPRRSQPRDGAPLPAGLDASRSSPRRRRSTRGAYTLDSRFYDPGYCIEYGKQVCNSADQSGPEAFGNVNFVAGARALGQLRLLQDRQAARRQEDPRLRQALRLLLAPAARDAVERAQRERAYNNGRLFYPKNDYQVDPGRLAFGQERMLVTPIQMAMVAAGDRQRRARDASRTSSSGSSRRTARSSRGRRRTSSAARSSAKTASELNGMMQAVVTGGTGTAAQIPGVRGRRQDGNRGDRDEHVNTTGSSASRPPTTRRSPSRSSSRTRRGFGGTTAAPIAKTIMEALLR